MNLPADLKYTEEHEWVKLENDTIAIIGITDFAQSELGELVYVEIDTLDEELEAGEVFGTVEAVKTTSELFMPVAGKVVEFNSKISDDGDDEPGLINTDPYGDGWIVKIEVSDKASIDGLLDAEAYKAIIA